VTYTRLHNSTYCNRLFSGLRSCRQKILVTNSHNPNLLFVKILLHSLQQDMFTTAPKTLLSNTFLEALSHIATMMHQFTDGEQALLGALATTNPGSMHNQNRELLSGAAATRFLVGLKNHLLDAGFKAEHMSGVLKAPTSGTYNAADKTNFLRNSGIFMLYLASRLQGSPVPLAKETHLYVTALQDTDTLQYLTPKPYKKIYPDLQPEPASPVKPEQKRNVKPEKQNVKPERKYNVKPEKQHAEPTRKYNVKPEKQHAEPTPRSRKSPAAPTCSMSGCSSKFLDTDGLCHLHPKIFVTSEPGFFARYNPFGKSLEEHKHDDMPALETDDEEDATQEQDTEQEQSDQDTEHEQSDQQEDEPDDEPEPLGATCGLNGGITKANQPCKISGGLNSVGLCRFHR
jgi:hypothetical protein